MGSQTVSFALAVVAVFVPAPSSEAVTVSHVGVLVAQMLEQSFATCSLVLMTTDSHSPLFTAIQRHGLNKMLIYFIILRKT